MRGFFAAMMRKTPEERFLMGLDMMATARRLVWASLEGVGTNAERRAAFFQRFYGMPLPEGMK